MEDVLMEQLKTLQDMLQVKEKQIKYLENYIKTVIHKENSNAQPESLQPYFSGDY